MLGIDLAKIIALFTVETNILKIWNWIRNQMSANKPEELRLKEQKLFWWI